MSGLSNYESRKRRAERVDALSVAMFRGVLAFCSLAMCWVTSWVFGRDHMGVWWFFFIVFALLVLGMVRPVYRYLTIEVR